jgi:hypothetical protein
MESTQYSEPVKALLTYGSPQRSRHWPNYLEQGFSHDHIPELIVMLTDESLHRAQSTSDDIWAPLYAWRVLGQLQAIEAIPALLNQLFRIDANDDDWAGEELPEVFAMIGAPAISGLRQYLAEPTHTLFARVAAAHSLANIGKHHADARHSCIAALEEQLMEYRQNDQTLNGFLVSYLLELKAVEALPTIQEAYRHECVDVTITGDCEDAEIEFGVRTVRTTPRPRPWWSENLERSRQAPAKSSSHPQQTTVRGGKKKVGRNDPCPCGSGKKYKKCCLNKSAS